jgi:quinoprotein glucose dehydrogenase
MKAPRLGSYVGWSLTASIAVLLLGVVMLRGAPGDEESRYSTWSEFAGSSDSMQYSSLKQINKDNVAKLELVWSYAAPGEGGPGRFSFSPLVVDSVMYVGGKNNESVVALDATTGKELWSYKTDGRPTNWGYSWWQSKDGRDRRLIFASNSYLQQLDLRTGAPIRSFGQNGRVDLRIGLGDKPARGGQCNNPGRVFENLIILGACTGEGYDDPPGWMRAYEVLSGKLVWTFHTVPLPGEFGYDTWPPDAYKNTGGANTWVNFSIDDKRGIGYVPTGSPTYDFYGARRKGANLFGNTLLALDLRTGKRVWHYQLLHHDLWDYDVATEPKLLTVRHEGKLVDIVAQATKWGMLYVFNRETGQPLWPIIEQPVPASDVPGEEASKTQPVPTKPPPYSRLKMTVDDINPYVEPAERERLRKIFLAARHEGVFTPATADRDQIQLPGEFGGTNWGGTSADPQTGMLYVRAENMATIHRLFERNPTRRFTGGTREQQGHVVWAERCESCHGPDEAGVKSLVERNAARLRTIIREGVGNMTGLGYSDLAPSDDHVDALLAYMANPSAGAAPLPAAGSTEAPSIPPGETRRFFAQFGHMWLANDGQPAIAPPWAELVAYDLNEGTIKWRVPLGTAPGLAARGIKNTGSFRPTRNGPVVTAGGLIFLGSEADRTVRAYDKDNGRILWEKELESNPQSIPAVFEVGGRQYVAFFLSSGRAKNDLVFKQGKPEAQGYYVFALPR